MAIKIRLHRLTPEYSSVGAELPLDHQETLALMGPYKNLFVFQPTRSISFKIGPDCSFENSMALFMTSNNLSLVNPKEIIYFLYSDDDVDIEVGCNCKEAPASSTDMSEVIWLM